MAAHKNPDMAHLDDVCVEASVRLGRRRVTVRELSEMTEDSVLVLESRVDEPVQLVIGQL